MDSPGGAAARERWEWRRRLRATPGRYRFYRLAVGLVGVALALVGLALGAFPGPGGVPLVLAGLAILASEYIWARRLLDRARVQMVAASRWAARQPPWLRAVGSASGLAGVAGAAYLGLVVVGAPSWLPDPGLEVLVRLPGVEVRAVR